VNNVRIFKVLIHGKNVLIKHESGLQKGGFFSIRIVEATTKDEAVFNAIENIWRTSSLAEEAKNADNDPPQLEAEEVTELEEIEEAKPGLVYYIEDE